MNSGVQAVPSRQDLAARWENPASRIQFALLACLLLYLYGSIFVRLASQWSHDSNFSHGFFVPAFALYVLWERREALVGLDRRPAWSGAWLLKYDLEDYPRIRDRTFEILVGGLAAPGALAPATTKAQAT